ncbi:MAG: type II toxin-antitoxin system prevent-host-death family antitoxin [Solirubrobacterales bacterium]
MAHREIPQRELRNNVSAVLREAEAGGTFTVTVHGRPVARLIPPEHGPRQFVDRETVRRLLAMPIDSELAADLDAAEAPIDNPWEDG